MDINSFGCMAIYGLGRRPGGWRQLQNWGWRLTVFYFVLTDIQEIWITIQTYKRFWICTNEILNMHKWDIWNRHNQEILNREVREILIKKPKRSWTPPLLPEWGTKWVKVGDFCYPALPLSAERTFHFLIQVFWFCRFQDKCLQFWPICCLILGAHR